jgi:hypothetical protein
MAMDKGAFRKAFPEFSDVTEYPESVMNFWESVASAYVSENKWGTLYVQGMSLVLAHLLTLAKNNQSGQQGAGPISNQSVGDVSVGFDTSSTAEDRAGQWNLTTYGKQYIRLARMIGGVAMQI